MKNRSTKGRFLVALTAITLAPLTAHSVNGQDPVPADDPIVYAQDTYTYKLVDDHEILADVYRYPGEEIRPAIIWLHGGALITGTRKWLSSEQLEMYLKAGYVVVAIDYRLAPETKLAAIIEDLEDAYAWVRAEGPGLFNIDPDRIGVVGASAGGYLTLMAGFRLEPRPRALVSFYGYGDITGPWYSQPDSFYNQRPPISKEQAFEHVGDSTISSSPWSGRAQFYLYSRQQGLWPREVSGHDPEQEHEWFAAYEPLRNVTPAYPPTMLLHGEKDTDVPFEQSVRMAEALERHGVDYEFASSPDWRHGFDNRGWEAPLVQEAFGQVLLFLEKHVRQATGGVSALRAMLDDERSARDASRRSTILESANLTTETYRSLDEVIGVAETALTMEGELPAASRWKAEVYRWVTGADIGFAHQWPPGLQFAPGEIRLEDLFDTIGRDSVFIFQLTGEALRRMINFNIRRDDPRLHVALAGVTATFELHDDASENRVIEWGLDDDSTYTVAGDLHEPNALRNFLGFIPEWTPAGLTAFQAAIRWFETHNQVRDMPSWIRIVRRR